MGVLSKALRFTSLAAVVMSVGCATSQSVSEPGDVGADLAQSAIEPTINADQAALRAETAAAGEELLSATEAGVGLSTERGSGYSRFIVDLNNPEPVFDVTMVKNPARLVVDVLGEPGKNNKEVSLTDDAFLKSVRLGAHKDRTRLVFDIKQSISADDVAHEVDAQNGKLVVTFHSNGEAAPVASAAVATDAGAVEETVELAVNAPEATSPVEPVLEASASAEPVEAIAESSEVPTEVVAAAEIAPETEVAAAQPIAGNITLDSMKFEKTNNDAGHVLLSLSDQTAFELRKTAPSEYVLTVAGATADNMTTYPQIAPKGFPGIRSARASQVGESTAVRMFVDPGTTLIANARDNAIVISAEPTAIAGNADARAQLEAGDTPQGTAVPASGTTDTTARENPTGIRAADGSKTYTGRLISLDLQDTDIDNALRIIAEVSNLNIIASDDVTGKVTLRLIDVPWDQALDVILKTNGLDQVTEGNVIRIAPIDKLRQEREALREAEKAKELLQKLTVSYIRVSYARAAELKEQVEAVLSERGTVSVDERTNQLIIKDTASGQETASDLLKKLDLRTPQVLLETQIVESSRNILRDLGFQWNFSYINSPATGNSTGLNFPNSVAVGGSNNGQLVSFPAVIGDNEGSAISAILDSADGSRALAARITALESERKVRVISRPQVATVNNKQAEISSVETLRVRTPSSGTAISTGSGASAASGASNAFEEIKVGIELKVTPQASPDYFVLLDVDAKSSTLGANEVDAIPSTLDRDATSTVLVKSGQTFALGGVYRLEDTDSVPGVPFLKDIPVLGHLFRRTLVDKQDEELIFFITPHIVEGSFDPSLM